MENEQQLNDWYENKKEYMKNWREKNKEQLNKKARETYEANKEKRKERARELYKLKKERKQQYYQDNKEKILELRKKETKRIKNNHLIKRYGITLEEYQNMIKLQENKCYICNIYVENTKKNYLHVDHDHNSGKVRKLLCMSCNASLGLVKENKQTLFKMIDYLNEHE